MAISILGRVKEFFRYRNGDTFYSVVNGSSSFATLTPEMKLNYMLTNPALAKVVFLNCDVFSLAKIKRKDEKEDALTKFLKNPNYFQTERQFLWSYRFWLMFGNAYLLPYNNRIDSPNQNAYWLNPVKMTWDKNLLRDLDKLILAKDSKNEILDKNITYRYNDGSYKNIKLKEIINFHDLSNGINNWYEGASRIDSLWKVLYNSESALDAKNINLEFARKFLVSGNYDPAKNLNSLNTMQDIEKEGIISKLRGNNPVHPVKSEVNIKRFVEDLAKLQLDESYNNDLSKIGSIYNIPSDILEALKQGSTYENQEKSIGRHIGYSEMPKALDFLESLCSFFNLNSEDYEITFNNNSFMQVFQKEKAQVNFSNAKTLEVLIKAGADPNEAAEYLEIDLKFKKVKDENPQEAPIE